MSESKYSEIEVSSSLPIRERRDSILIDKTADMGFEQHLLEQQGLRKFGARVNEKARSNQIQGDLEEGMEMKSAHPYLKQKYDGISDSEFIPFIPDNPEAQRELENTLRLQHQKRLEKNKEISFSPKPLGP